MFLRSSAPEVRVEIVSMIRAVINSRSDFVEIRATTTDHHQQVVCQNIPTASGKPGRWQVSILGPNGGFRGKFCSRVSHTAGLVSYPRLFDFIDRWFPAPLTAPSEPTGGPPADTETTA